MKKHCACIDYATNHVMMNSENHCGFRLSYHHPRHKITDPNVRRNRPYFRDMMPVMSSLSNVMNAYNPGSNWLAHVAAIIQHYQVATLSTTRVPAPMSLTGVLRSNNSTVNGRFTPTISNAARSANIDTSPGHPNHMQHPTEDSASGSASAVTFDIDGSNSTVSGTSTTPGPLIVSGAAIPSSNAETYDSCDTDFFRIRR